MALWVIFNIFVFLVVNMGSKAEAQSLKVGFYKNKCNADVEQIVKEEVKKAFLKNNGIAPGLLRMHFHDCFVRGCDASILINSTHGNSAEMDSPPNGRTLRGFEVINNAKSRLEKLCRRVVSCADILAFAARDSAHITGGFRWDVPAGRRDGRISRIEDTKDIPAPSLNLDQINQIFAKKGLTQDDMIALVGVHTIGRSHCTSFSDRLYNFNSTHAQDPSLNALYAAQLKKRCPRGPNGAVDPNHVVQMNKSPNLLDQSYYQDVLAHRGLFTSDQTLTSTTDSAKEVREYAEKGVTWQKDFRTAMIKMSQIEVLTGSKGEIRANCMVINP